MSIGLVVLVALCQGDPFQTLADPAARADETRRNAALAEFHKQADSSLLHWCAAQILQRHATTLPPALNGFLKTHWTGAPMDPTKHQAALKALIAASDGKPTDAVRLLALPHVAALGPKGADAATRLGMEQFQGRWAWGEFLRVATSVNDFKNPDGRAALTGAVSRMENSGNTAGGSFTSRYADAMGKLNRALAGKEGCEATWKLLLSLRSGPRNIPAHIKALGVGLMKAAKCEACNGGQVTCPTCKGKRKADQKCPNCKGVGKLRPASAVGKTNVMVKCGACAGRGQLKNASCFTCAKKGTVPCSACKGKVWKDVCTECLLGKVPCAACKGKRQIQTPCPDCKKGRVIPDNDYGKRGFTMACKKCKGRGKLFTPCTQCGKGGQATCRVCSGTSRTPGFRIPPSAVYSTTPCKDCGGNGWQFPNAAIPCSRCCGLGVLIRPAADPSQVLK